MLPLELHLQPQCPTWEILFQTCSVCPPMTQVLGCGLRETVIGKSGILLPDYQGLGQALGSLLVVLHSDLQKRM